MTTQTTEAERIESMLNEADRQSEESSLRLRHEELFAGVREKLQNVKLKGSSEFRKPHCG